MSIGCQRSGRGAPIWELGLAVALVMSLWGCGPGGDKARRLTAEESAAAAETIVRWLECEDCLNGELEAVVALGDVAVPTLATALETGPSDASIELVGSLLELNHRKLVEVSGGDVESLPMSERRYVETFLDAYVIRFRYRAALALSETGSSKAEAVLDAAAAGELGEPARTAVSTL